MNTYILLIEGKDEQGLINKITSTIFAQGLNIVLNDEFVEKENQRFFMRSKCTGSVNIDEIVSELKRSLPNGFKITFIPQRKKDIIVMVTKEHHCLADLLIRHEFNKLNARICCVIGNRPGLQSLVNKFQIPFYHVTHLNKTREDHESAILKIIEEHNPDYIILAKYMRILSPNFVKLFPNKIINIHHSFLPAFIGANPYEQAFYRGVKIIGATSHFVTAEIDEGPIITQEVVSISHKHSIEDMKQVGQDAEILALSKALKSVLEDRVFVSGNKTIIFS
jgi:formyltetrahydrofolate deformylase